MKKEKIDGCDIEVYLAGPFATRSKIKRIAKKLQDNGFQITSSWLDQKGRKEFNLQGPISDKLHYAIKDRALEDVMDITSSEAVIVCPEDPPCSVVRFPPRKGRAFEIGYAVAKKIPVFLYRTPIQNLFEYQYCYGPYHDLRNLQKAVIAVIADNCKIHRILTAGKLEHK